MHGIFYEFNKLPFSFPFFSVQISTTELHSTTSPACILDKTGKQTLPAPDIPTAC